MAHNPLVLFVGLSVAALGGLIAVSYQAQKPEVTAPQTALQKQTIPLPSPAERKTPPNAAPASTAKAPSSTTKTPASQSEAAGKVASIAPPGSAPQPRPVVKPQATQITPPPAVVQQQRAKSEPEFGLVRIEPDGGAVITGRAKPGAKVALKLDGKVIGRATANKAGDWVFVPDMLIPKGPHEMTAEVETSSGKAKASRQSVIISMPKDPDATPLVVISTPDKPTKVVQKPKQTAVALNETPKAPAATESAPAASPAPAKEKPATGAANAKKPASPAADTPAESTPPAATALHKKPTAAPQQPAGQSQASAPAPAAKLPAGKAAPAAPAVPAGKTDLAAAPQKQQAVSTPPSPPAPASPAPQVTAKAKPASPAPEAAAKAKPAKPAAGKPEIVARAAPARPAQPAPSAPAAKTPPRPPVAMALKLGTIDYNDSGDIVFSGKASPGATVRLYVDNRFLGDALVNGLGDWSFRGREQIKPGVHQIRADLLSKGGKVVQRTGVPFVRANPDRVAALLKTRTGNAGQPAPASPPAAPKTQQAVKKQPAPASLPPAAPVQEKQPAPAGPAPTAAKTLPRDVQKTARAAPGKPAFEKTASKAAPPVTAPQPAVQPEPVRLPQTAAQSQPAAKPATTREVQDGPPGQPAAAQEKLKTQVVIQPGNNLWNIARVIYGKGIQYTVIYEANKNQIRNPDLIYPGQIFITPGVATTGKVDPRQRRPLKQPAVQ